jgi:hypothetical protein
MFTKVSAVHAEIQKQLSVAISEDEARRVAAVLSSVEQHFGDLEFPNPISALVYADGLTTVLAALSATLADPISTALANEHRERIRAARERRPTLVTGEVF